MFYTALGDEKAGRTNSARALGRAAPFLRRQIGSRLRLKRVPELQFVYDDSIAGAGPHRAAAERDSTPERTPEPDE